MNGGKVSKMMENRVFSQEELLKMKKIMDRVRELAEKSYRKGYLYSLNLNFMKFEF